MNRLNAEQHVFVVVVVIVVIVAAAAKLFFTFLQISERGQTDNARSIIVQLTSQEEDEESEGDKDATMKTLYLSFRCSNHKRHL